MFAARPLVALAAAAVLALGCASAGGGTGSTRGSRDVLTQEQLADASVSTAFEAVQRLRSSWLRPRGAGTLWVYVDGVRAGNVDHLRTMSTSGIIEIRYVSATDATMRWGTGHTAGAIEVITR